ncbi:MAG: hypothetical protein Kow0099_21340 [Candidatus Abyssubacteria bacterium]
MTAEKAERFLLHLVEEKGLGRKTRNTYLAALWQFGQWDVKRGRWPHNPFDSVSKLRADVDRRIERSALTADEARRLLEAARTRPVEEYRRVNPNASPWRSERLERVGRERALLYRFAIETGLRRHEIKTLTWGEPRFERKCSDCDH